MHCRILVPIDGSPCAQGALEEAIALAAEQQSRLCLLHLSEEDTRDRGLNVPVFGAGLLARARLAAFEKGVQADTSVRAAPRQRVADLICREAEDEGCDLIVMGSSGRGRAMEMGRVAERVLRKATVPVIVFREEARHAAAAGAPAH